MGAARPFVAPFIALRGRAFGSIALVIAVFGFAKNPALPVIALIIFVAPAMIERLSTQNRCFLFTRRRIVETSEANVEARLACTEAMPFPDLNQCRSGRSWVRPLLWIRKRACA